MDISQKESRGVKVVSVIGRLDAVTAPELGAALEGVGGQLVLDLGQLQYVSSAGLRVILAAAKRQRAGGADLRLAGLQESVKKVFEISGFDSILSIHENCDAAIDAATS